jgi:hypothetical protein
MEAPTAGKQTHVTVFIPVLLPDGLTTQRSEGLYGSPWVEVAARRFPARAWKDIHLEGSPDSVALPRGWSMALYVCDVPLRFVGRTFEAKVSYLQPHFPNDVAAYVPIRPPQDKNSSVIAFLAEPGRKLRRVSFFSVLLAKKDRIEFAPRDRKLIRVQSLQGRD